MTGRVCRGSTRQGDGQVAESPQSRDIAARFPTPQHPPPTPEDTMRTSHAGEVLIQLEFLQIQYSHARAPFIARLIDLESQPGKPDPSIHAFGYLDNDRVVTYDPPGTASVYVSKKKELQRATITKIKPEEKDSEE